jgi:hypothetical protein
VHGRMCTSVILKAHGCCWLQASMRSVQCHHTCTSPLRLPPYYEFRHTTAGANQGMVGMAKEHLGLALALQVPVFVRPTPPPARLFDLSNQQTTCLMLDRLSDGMPDRNVPHNTEGGGDKD